MPPRRYVVFAASVILFCWLIVYQISSQPFAQAFTQIEATIPEQAPLVEASSLLDIQVTATNNGPKRIGETVTFTAVVSGAPIDNLTFYWEFGDGVTDKGRVRQHTYERAGTYKATVTVSDGIHGIQADTYVTIYVDPTRPPMPIPISGLMATGNSPTIAGNPTSFVATIMQGSDVTYEWVFGDGATQAGGSSVSHVYQLPGDYPVRVTARNQVSTVVYDFMVWIFEAPPRGLRITGPNESNINTITTFTATIEGGTNVKFEWSFSDGEITNDNSPDPLVRKTTRTRPFRSAGLHTVSVTASNSAGKLSAKVTILIKDELPTFVSLISDRSIPVGEPMAFAAFVRSNAKVTGEWLWGDGSGESASVTPDTENSSLKEFRATHRYAKEGRYKVTFLARNTGGVVSQEIIATYGIIPATEIPRVEIFYQPPRPIVGKPITYTLPLERRVLTCTWNFGDGSPPFPTDVSTSHVYTTAKGYIVTVDCVQPRTEPPREYHAERIVYIGVELFMPALFDPRPSPTPTVTPTPLRPGLPGGEATVIPTSTATATETATMTPLPVETPTPTATPTETPIPPVIETATETPTATPTPPVIDTPTATPTLLLTAPVFETPTETPTMLPGGTIPQP